MKLDSKSGTRSILDLVMEKIRGKVTCLCILFLAISWPDGSLGSPISVGPLLNKYFVSDGSSISNCNLNAKSSASQNPSYESSSSISSILKQQLLDQAAMLIKQLSSPASEDADEGTLLQSLVDRLEAFEKTSALSTNSSLPSSAISEATYNAITDQYLRVRLQTLKLLSQRDTEIVQSALDALYKTFVKIITGQLPNVELPNLCSKTLALNTQLKAITVPTMMRDEITDFMTSLTLALTGQSQVTISGLCDGLNDLETSIVTVTENDKSQRLKYLLSNLVDAVTNAVASGGDVGCNVIDIVQRYVVSMKKAIQEETNVRTGKIYTSVLKFEEELNKVLFAPGSREITLTTPNQRTTPLLKPETMEEYINEIGRLSKLIFGNRTKLVKSAVETLLRIKKLDDPKCRPAPSHPTETTLENLQKVYDLLKSIISISHPDSTQVVEAIVELLSTLPQADTSKVLDALSPIPEQKNQTDRLEDATDIVSDGQLFILKGKLLQKLDDDGNIIDIVQSGSYNLVDAKTNISRSGNYAVQEGSIRTDERGNIFAKGSGVYDVNQPKNDQGKPGPKRVGRQANFAIEDRVFAIDNGNENPRVKETGIYNLTDLASKTHKSGKYVVESTVAQENPDGSIDVIKAGRLYVNKPGAESPSQRPPLSDSPNIFLFNDHISKSPGGEGKNGTGVYNIKNPKTGAYQSGTYVIRNMTSTKNSDGSVNSTSSGFIYTNDVHQKIVADRGLTIVNGSRFKYVDHLAYAPNVDGNVIPISTGKFIQTEPKTGKTTTASYIVQNIVSTDNPDGSTDITKFGEFSDITVRFPKSKLPAESSSSEQKKPATHSAAKPLPITKASHQALIDSLNPVKPVQPDSNPAKPNPSSTTESPQPSVQPSVTNDNDDGSNDQNPNCAYYDATSIAIDGTSFIIDKYITTLVDAEGNAIGEIGMGTYHLMDTRTNVSWSGVFEIEQTLIREISSDNTEVITSGTFNVAPPDNDCYFTIEGEFEIVDQLKNGISQGGSYYLRDSTTGASKTGIFVGKNTVIRPKPGNTSQIIKTGLLFDESDATPSSLSEETVIPGYDGYFFSDERIYAAPDSDGNSGAGVLSIEDPETKKYTLEDYSILKTSSVKDANGTLERSVEALMDADDVNTDIYASSSEIINRVTFTADDHLAYVTDKYGHVSLIGTGKYTRTDPEAEEIQSVSTVMLNVATIEDTDGSSIVRKFGVFRRDDDSDSSSTTQAPTTTDQPEPFLLEADNFDAFVRGLNPMNLIVQGSPVPQPDSKQNTPSTPNGKPVEANDGNISQSTKGNPIEDPIEVATDGAYVTILQHVTPRVDGKGYGIGELRTGIYSIRDPIRNLTWSGNFDVEDVALTSITQGQIDVTASGRFDVVLPDDGSSNTRTPKKQANFSIKGHAEVVADENGTLNSTETGAFSLTNPTTRQSRNGDYVILSGFSKTNPDGSIDIVKFGIMYLHELCASPSSENPRPIEHGGYFVRDNHLLPSPDGNGLYGVGAYSIKDSKTNQVTSGTYEINKLFTKNNTDGTTTEEASGKVFVDSLRSSSSLINAHPSLYIVDGALYTFADRLSSRPDANGNIIPVGTGVFYQTDLKTNITTCLKYVIQDIITTVNPDGSMEQIAAGIFYTSDNDAPNEPTNPSDSSTKSPAPNSNLDATLSQLSKALEALITSRDASRPPVAQQSESISTSASPQTAKSSETVLLPRSDVVAALNGECLGSGDIVAIESENGAILLATIQDSFSPVTFRLSSFAELTGTVQTGQKIVVVKSSDFSKQYRSALDAVSKPSGAPCST